MKSRSLATRFADFYCQQLNWQTNSWEMTRRRTQPDPRSLTCTLQHRLVSAGRGSLLAGPKRHEAEKRWSLHCQLIRILVGNDIIPLLVLPIHCSRRNRSPHPCKESECLKCLGQNEQRSFSSYSYAFRILSRQHNALPIHNGPPQLSLTHSLGIQGAEELTDLFQCTTVVLLSPLSAVTPPPPA